jgi:hypothetical protein
MTHKKFKLPFQKRGRRRARPADDPRAVFKAFVDALARLQAQTRESVGDAASEKSA